MKSFETIISARKQSRWITRDVIDIQGYGTGKSIALDLSVLLDYPEVVEKMARRGKEKVDEYYAELRRDYELN